MVVLAHAVANVTLAAFPHNITGGSVAHGSHHLIPALRGNAAQSNAWIQDLDSLLILLSGEHAPMSLALSCVTVLTFFFFGIYLAMLLVRWARLCITGAVGLHLAYCEAILTEATDALSLAPMLAVLMISARLRAVELDSKNGDPQRWAQFAMLLGTIAFLLRFAWDLILCGLQKEIGFIRKTFQLLFFLVSVLVYGACAAIVVSIITLEAKQTSATPPLPCMMRCLLVLAGSYLLEYSVLERRIAVRAGKPPTPKPSQIDEKAGKPTATPSTAPLQNLMDETEERQHMEAEDRVVMESMSLQLPLMLCVLLVAITLRAVQLRLQMPMWACIAMYATSVVVAVQAAWAAIAAAMAQCSDDTEKPLEGFSFFEWRHLCDSSLHFWPPAASHHRARRPGAADQDGPDAAAGLRPQARSCVCMAAVWGVLMGILYIGTIIILASVLSMEAQTLAEREATAPALSASMRCVMILTVVYFSSHLCLLMSGLFKGSVRSWAVSIREGIQRSLAFVPMLCIMMIAVRLRSMQLGLPDPQKWARLAMYTATCAVATQVACSLFPDKTLDEEIGLTAKLLAVVLLGIRLIASAVLYGVVSALIVALYIMEPAVA